MKKVLSVVLVFLMIPISAFGKTYEAKSSGFKISFNEEYWDVFVSGKSQNITLLEEYNTTNKSMQDYLDKNYMYIYAVYNGNNFSFSARYGLKKVLNKFDNYDKFGKKIAEQLGASDYEIYENKYKYIKLEYYDSYNKVYLIDYCIIIDLQYYSFSAQKETEFSDKEKEEIKRVVDSITFNENTKQSSEFKIDIPKIIKYLTICVISSSLTYFILKKYKKIN